MALNIRLNDNYGNGGASYWKVIEINRNLLANTTHVVLAGFVNEEARQSEKQPMIVKTFDYTSKDNPFTLEELNKEGVNEISLAYDKIKEDGIFTEAINC